MRHAGPAALPRAQEHSAHGPIHRNGARPVQGLLEGLTVANPMSWGGPVRSKPFGLALSPFSSGPVSVRSARRFVLRRGPGSLTGSAIPSITLASAPASRAASIPWIISIAASICSSVIALMPPLCSICISLGTNIAQTFKYAAGDSRRTRLNTSRPCCCDGHDTRALQHYLGHKNIQHTVRYTEMAPDRFKDFWRD